MPNSPRTRRVFSLLVLTISLATAQHCQAADAGRDSKSGLPEWVEHLLLEHARSSSEGIRALLAPLSDRAVPSDSEEAEAAEVQRAPLPVYPWTLTSDASPRLEESRTATGVNNAAWTFFGPEATYWSTEEVPAQPLRTLHANITAFAVSPSNPNIVYAGSETGALSKSFEKGALWSPMAQSDTLLRSKIYSLAVQPGDPNTVYLGNDRGILKSTNGGASWSVELSITDINAGTIAINPTAQANLLVSGVALFSKTAGLWDIPVNRQTDDVAFKPGNSTIAYALIRTAAGDSVQFFKSTDSGATWSIRRTGWSARINSLLGARMAVTPAAPNRIYVLADCIEGLKLMRSDDAGETWTIKGSSTDQGYGPDCQSPAGAFTLGVGQGYYDMAIAASPTNADQIIFGTSNTRKSMDGGTTSGWECGMYVHPDAQEMVCIGGDSWIVTDGGVSHSSDFWTTSANFSSRIRGLRGTEIWGFGQGWNDDFMVSGRFHNAYAAWYEGYPDGSFLTTGSGEVVSGWVNPAISRMAYLGSSVSFAYVWPATFGGPRALSAIAKWPYENGFLVGDEMNFGDQEWDPRHAYTYYVGRTDGVWRTKNNGSTFDLLWNHSDPAALEQHIEVSRTNPDVIYVTVKRDASGELWKSIDRGRTFTQCANPTGPTAAQRRLSQITMSGTDPNVLWWCFRNGPDGNKVFETTDGGQSWTNLTTPILNGVVLVNMYHQLGTQGGVYLIGGFGAVLYRNDLMSDWAPFNSGLPANLHQGAVWGAIHYPKQLLRLGTTSGIWQSGLFESPATTLVQPMAVASDSISPCDTLQLESYSVTNGAATYHWSFTPAPLYLSNADIRNPRVVFGTPGAHAVTLDITDLNGTTSRTIPNFINAGGVLYADSVVAKSSEYTLTGPPAWYATQALGPPDTYPTYGDIPTAWASLDEDAQPEFLQLHFPSARPINFVQVYETLNPGALTEVSVKNPSTNAFVTVWSAPAVPAPPVARVYTAHFADPGFPVDQVRLDFDSQLVPGWNEIDAVGIGKATCTASLLGVEPAQAPIANRLDFVGPNPFVASAGFRFTLARPGHVRAEIFDLMGRRVARIEDRYLPAGSHEARWDGRGAQGRDAASGVYYVRMDLAGVVNTAKVIKLK